MWWSFFGAGGALSALFYPALLGVLFLGVPMKSLEPIPHDYLISILDPLYSRIILFGLITASSLHFAHRFRFTLYDGLQLQHMRGVVGFLCYGSAIGISVIAVYVLWNF
jgi:fumarate reductase subunit D